ncbi:MAG: molybdopterin-guanine dinucleotide biosynthesis protein B [Desulfobacter sp.]|nr:molybdopterin-guanine dinucleotide biosynthesis protein B [Desulfobacter sp.]WDP84730.1 MAG: molybdopterin-guanine dinucleotide biosynthesis protein B [Desulfobacter sp.]
MSPQILLIVGKSNAGKTTLAEKLIHELKKRSYTIGSVKHTHDRFDFDKKGKDSWRHKKAGADAALVITDSRVALVKDDSRKPIEKMQDYLGGMDLILVEGFKRQAQPKIEIFRTDSDHKAPFCLEDPHLAAFVTDSNIRPNRPDIPVFGLEEAVKLADFIEASYILPEKEKTNET